MGDAIATMDVDTGVETIVSDVPGTIEHRGGVVARRDADRVPSRRRDRGHQRRWHGPRPLPDRLTGGSIGWSPDGKWIYGKSTSDREVDAIDAAGKRAPVLIKLDGTGGWRLQLAANRAVARRPHVAARPRFAPGSLRVRHRATTCALTVPSFWR